MVPGYRGHVISHCPDQICLLPGSLVFTRLVRYTPHESKTFETLDLNTWQLLLISLFLLLVVQVGPLIRRLLSQVVNCNILAVCNTRFVAKHFDILPTYQNLLKMFVCKLLSKYSLITVRAGYSAAGRYCVVIAILYFVVWCSAVVLQ